MIVMMPELAFGWVMPEIIITLCAILTLLMSAFGRKTGSGS